MLEDPIISHDNTSHLDIVIAVKCTASAQLPVTCSTVKHTVTPLVWLSIYCKQREAG